MGLWEPEVTRTLGMAQLIAEFRKEVFDGVNYFQLSKTRDGYFQCIMAFPGRGRVDSYIDYYHKQWANSGESNWFAGASFIDINNGLGAVNKDMKVLRFSVINRKLGHPLYMLLLRRLKAPLQ